MAKFETVKYKKIGSGLVVQKFEFGYLVKFLHAISTPLTLPTSFPMDPLKWFSFVGQRPCLPPSSGGTVGVASAKV